MNQYNFYLIVYQISDSINLTIGKLGDFELPKGYYLYIGRDKRNIRSRVSRHIAHKKKLRWHIDYLSQNATPILMRLLPYRLDELSECDIAEKFIQQGAQVIVPGFGASDCNCFSHLLHFENFQDLTRLIDEMF
ncbi:GIY-YIG nuclease family protein [Natranaerobius thermophilus]|uniref:GIY-YIG domain-containing protein n=1 Tax=Natranaerobius thermophilus (strain ATCC BAA-1301 / DSM 18059 / JW/NM-WN-LF) TaxID=457570 RepID=B2A6P0_NATTJ|nr:GIY-YIG nuclease family protein [Natranaerobius thermophilus]ACB84173.1 protein of unknown function DUF123 [Natranaerobius thermophilus JW/NM-WN-LF]